MYVNVFNYHYSCFFFHLFLLWMCERASTLEFDHSFAQWTRWIYYEFFIRFSKPWTIFSSVCCSQSKTISLFLSCIIFFFLFSYEAYDKTLLESIAHDKNKTERDFAMISSFFTHWAGRMPLNNKIEMCINFGQTEIIILMKNWTNWHWHCDWWLWLMKYISK